MSYTDVRIDGTRRIDIDAAAQKEIVVLYDTAAISVKVRRTDQSAHAAGIRVADDMTLDGLAGGAVLLHGRFREVHLARIPGGYVQVTGHREPDPVPTGVSRRSTLDAFGLTEDDITNGFESEDAARAAARSLEADYRAALPRRMAEVAEELSAGLPSGLHFEWADEDR